MARSAKQVAALKKAQAVSAAKRKGRHAVSVTGVGKPRMGPKFLSPAVRDRTYDSPVDSVKAMQGSRKLTKKVRKLKAKSPSLVKRAGYTRGKGD